MTNPPDPKTKTPRTDAQVERMTGMLKEDQFIPSDFARTLELENQSLTRRLEEVENNNAILQAKVDDQAEIIKFGSGECDRLNARITEAEKERDAWKRSSNLYSDGMHKVGDILATRKNNGYLIMDVEALAKSRMARLTALRTAAEAARDALECIADQSDKTATGMRSCAKAALAALRAELGEKQ